MRSAAALEPLMEAPTWRSTASCPLPPSPNAAPPPPRPRGPRPRSQRKSDKSKHRRPERGRSAFSSLDRRTAGSPEEPSTASLPLVAERTTWRSNLPPANPSPRVPTSTPQQGRARNPHPPPSPSTLSTRPDLAAGKTSPNPTPDSNNILANHAREPSSVSPNIQTRQTPERGLSGQPVQSSSHPPPESTQSRAVASKDPFYLALDCEMVGVGPDKTSALARVSLVDSEGKVVYDTFVQPAGGKHAVTDCRTWVSGVTPSDLDNAPEFERVQGEVSNIIRDKYVIGHALINDFTALQLTHPAHLMRDTACNRWLSLLAHVEMLQVGEGNDVVPATDRPWTFATHSPTPLPSGSNPQLQAISLKARLARLHTLSPLTDQAVQVPSLKRLAKIVLGQQVQKTGPHSSIDDARTAMEIFHATDGLWDHEGSRQGWDEMPGETGNRSQIHALSGTLDALTASPANISANDSSSRTPSCASRSDFPLSPTSTATVDTVYSNTLSLVPAAEPQASKAATPTLLSANAPTFTPSLTHANAYSRQTFAKPSVYTSDTPPDPWLSSQADTYRALRSQLDGAAWTLSEHRGYYSWTYGLWAAWRRAHDALYHVRRMVEPLDPSIWLPEAEGTPSLNSLSSLPPNVRPRSRKQRDRLYASVTKEWERVSYYFSVLGITSSDLPRTLCTEPLYSVPHGDMGTATPFPKAGERSMRPASHMSGPGNSKDASSSPSDHSERSNSSLV